MKKLLLSLFVFFVTCSAASAQSLEEEMTNLLNSGDFLQLNERYATAKDSIQHETLKLMIEAFLYTSQNKDDKATKVFGDLLRDHQPALGMNGITACMYINALNLTYLGRYKESADMVKSFLDQTAAFNGLDSLTRKGLGNFVGLRVLGDSMKPQIIRPDRDCEIAILSNENFIDHLTYINVTINGNDVPFVFDTGCDGFGTNFVSEGFAKKHGIRILEDSVVISGIGTGYAKLGVTDSLIIGDIVYKNVAFTIAPGDNLLPVDTLYLDAVLGSAFMREIGEFHYYPQEKKIVFPAKQTPLPESGANLMFRTGQLYLAAYSGNERLLLHFDTGGGLGLSSRYYLQHKETVEATGKLRKEGGVGGFGGMKEIPQYILSGFPLEIGGKKRVLEKISAWTSTDFAHVENSDGSVGFDYFEPFEKVIVNLDKMFVKAE